MIPSPEQDIILLSPLLGKNLALKILARWLVLKFVNTCEIKNKINFEPGNQKLLNISTLLVYKSRTSILKFWWNPNYTSLYITYNNYLKVVSMCNNQMLIIWSRKYIFSCFIPANRIYTTIVNWKLLQ